MRPGRMDSWRTGRGDGVGCGGTALSSQRYETRRQSEVANCGQSMGRQRRLRKTARKSVDANRDDVCVEKEMILYIELFLLHINSTKLI